MSLCFWFWSFFCFCSVLYVLILACFAFKNLYFIILEIKALDYCSLIRLYKSCTSISSLVSNLFISFLFSFFQTIWGCITHVLMHAAAHCMWVKYSFVISVYTATPLKAVMWWCWKPSKVIGVSSVHIKKVFWDDSLKSLLIYCFWLGRSNLSSDSFSRIYLRGSGQLSIKSCL